MDLEIKTGQASGALVAPKRMAEKLQIGLGIVVRIRQASVARVVPTSPPAKILKIGLGCVDRSGQPSVARVVRRKKTLRLIRISQASGARVVPTTMKKIVPHKEAPVAANSRGKKVRLSRAGK